MDTTKISNESLEMLRCHNCNHFLSIFPIYLNENVSICGRCVKPNDGFIRNYPYENAVKLTEFPCYYNQYGCQERFYPEELLEHERFCHFRKIKCPNSQILTCSWSGNITDLYQHYDNQHKAFLIRDGKFEIDFVHNYEDNFLLLLCNELFITKMKCNSNELKFKCSVYYLGHPTIASLFNYQIIVENTSKDKSKNYPIIQTLPMGSDDDNSTEIIMDELKEALNDPVSIIAKIEIKEITQKFQADTNCSNGNDTKSHLNLEMISELECPVCLDLMIAPIFQCVAGHSLCKTCKELNKQCPTCKQEIQNIRNYSLEKLTCHIYYPCKYRDFGCNFTSKADVIRNHEEFCFFATQDCPVKDYLNCNWLGPLHDIIEHVKNLHYDHYLQLEQISIPITNQYFRETDNDVFILKYGVDLFKLHYKYENDEFFWSMQLIGPKEECQKYMFEIDIIDNTGNNRRVYFKTFCSCLTSKEKCFSNDSDYIIVNYNQIGDMIGDNFIYRTRIINC